MKFCNVCSRIMTRQTSSGYVEFVCSCGERKRGEAKDSLIYTSVSKKINSIQALDMYDNFINTAPHDRVTCLVKKDCNICGLDYMALIRITDEIPAIYICKCGNKTN